MTGNTIRLGVYLSSSDWEAALPVGLMLLAFYFGGVFMLAFLDCSSHGRLGWLKLSTVGPSAVLAAAFVACDGIVLASAPMRQPERTLRLVSALNAFALGGQNVISGKSPCLGANTTFMTGTVKRISEGSYALIRGTLKPNEQETLVLLLLLWGGTLAGAAVGVHAATASVDTPIIGKWPLLPAAAMQAITLFLLRWLDPGPSSSPTRSLAVITPAPGTPTGSRTPSRIGSGSNSRRASRPSSPTLARMSVSAVIAFSDHEQVDLERQAAAHTAAHALAAACPIPYHHEDVSLHEGTAHEGTAHEGMAHEGMPPLQSSEPQPVRLRARLMVKATDVQCGTRTPKPSLDEIPDLS